MDAQQHVVQENLLCLVNTGLRYIGQTRVFLILTPQKIGGSLYAPPL